MIFYQNKFLILARFCFMIKTKHKHIIKLKLNGHEHTQQPGFTQL